jgi:hypothetical protein
VPLIFAAARREAYPWEAGALARLCSNGAAAREVFDDAAGEIREAMSDELLATVPWVMANGALYTDGAWQERIIYGTLGAAEAAEYVDSAASAVLARARGALDDCACTPLF